MVDAASVGLGIGIGSVQVALTEGFINPLWHTFGNILLGGIALGLSQYKKIRSKKIKEALLAYGFTAAIGGIVQGIFPITLEARLNGRLGVSPLTGDVAAVPGYEGGVANGRYEPTYYPGFSGLFYDRRQSRAQGWGSDVTRNPMARIPTTIPYNIINF